MPLAARSKVRVCGHSLVGIMGSNPVVGLDSVYYEDCVLWDRGPCDRAITRPEEFCRMWCVCVWYHNLNNEEAQAH
jgi:hypothetical protein